MLFILIKLKLNGELGYVKLKLMLVFEFLILDDILNCFSIVLIFGDVILFVNCVVIVLLLFCVYIFVVFSCVLLEWVINWCIFRLCVVLVVLRIILFRLML